MTDEERQKLCDWLKHLDWGSNSPLKQAADEIKRLAHALIELQQRFDSCQNQLCQVLEANDMLIKEARILIKEGGAFLSHETST